MKKHYYAVAINDQGASLDITHESSIRACENEARRQLGSGWKVKIFEVMIDGDGSSYMGTRDVKEFRIR